MVVLWMDSWVSTGQTWWGEPRVWWWRCLLVSVRVFVCGLELTHCNISWWIISSSSSSSPSTLFSLPSNSSSLSCKLYSNSCFHIWYKVPRLEAWLDGSWDKSSLQVLVVFQQVFKCLMFVLESDGLMLSITSGHRNHISRPSCSRLSDHCLLPFKNHSFKLYPCPLQAYCKHLHSCSSPLMTSYCCSATNHWHVDCRLPGFQVSSPYVKPLQVHCRLLQPVNTSQLSNPQTISSIGGFLTTGSLFYSSSMWPLQRYCA